MQINSKYQIALLYIFDHFFDEMDIYIGDSLTEFSNSFSLLNYKSYKSNLKMLKQDFDNIFKSLEFIKESNLDFHLLDYYINSFTLLEKQFKLYIEQDQIEIDKMK